MASIVSTVLARETLRDKGPRGPDGESLWMHSPETAGGRRGAHGGPQLVADLGLLCDDVLSIQEATRVRLKELAAVFD